MQSESKSKRVRFVARALSVVSVSLVSVFVVGNVMADGFHPRPIELVGFALFPIGVVSGMLLAWRNELFGGMLTVGSLIGFYIYDLILTGTLPSGPYFILFAAPGFLFLLAHYLQRLPARQTLSNG